MNFNLGHSFSFGFQLLRFQILRMAFPLVGIMALSHRAQAACHDCVTLDFGKKIQIGRLEPILQMDAQEKMKFFSQHGIDVYKMPADDPPTIAFLELAPNQFLGRYGKYFFEGVLGIFLTDRATYNRVQKPTILYSEGSDAWTHVHEFMHYLFDQARSLENPIEESRVVNNMSDAKEDFFNTWNRYKDLGRYANESHKVSHIESFLAFIDLQQELLLSFEIEEMTIEKYLKDRSSKERLYGFNSIHDERSLRYIRNTGTKALDILDAIQRTCSDTRVTLKPQDRDLIKKVNSSCSRASAYQHMILEFGKELGIQYPPPSLQQALTSSKFQNDMAPQ